MDIKFDWKLHKRDITILILLVEPITWDDVVTHSIIMGQMIYFYKNNM